MGQKEPQEWASDWAVRIGKNFQELRVARGLSAREVSDRCTELGFPIPRSTIANLESGRKAAVPVHEVLVLAAALGVTPLRLLYRVEGEDVEFLPDKHLHPMHALEWFADNSKVEGIKDTVKEDDWMDPVKRYRMHHWILGKIDEIRYSLDNIEQLLADETYANDPVPNRSRAREMAQLEDWKTQLRSQRSYIRSKGWILPELPPYLARLDEKETPDGA